MVFRMKGLFVVLFIFLVGNQLVSADPPAKPNKTAPFLCPMLPPLWHGLLCLAAGHSEKTIAICNQLLRDDSDNRRVHALRGYAYLLTKANARQAIADFTEVLKHDPGNAAIYVARARAFDQTKEYDRTIADCNEAIRLDPRSSEAYATRGECYEWKKATRKAIADYTAALRIDPKFTWARGKRASAYAGQGEGARALADYDELLRQFPDNREIKNDICSVYFFHFRNYDRVIAGARELIRKDPQEPRWYWMRGMAYLVKGEYIPGCCDAVVAVLLDPRRLQIRMSPRSCFVACARSNDPKFVFVADDKPEDRIAACTKRLHGGPNNPAAYYERAHAYIAKRDFKHAAADFDEIIRLDPSDAEAYRMRGNLHVELREFPDALDDFAEAMRLGSDNADTYTERAHAYAVMKKFDDALRDCTESLRLDSRSAKAYGLRGWLYLKSKKYDLAVADLSEAIRLCPADPDWYRLRADARSSLWDCVGTIADSKQVVKLSPANARACSQLAWFLTTCPDARLRDGKKAQRLAMFACKATSWRSEEYLSILANACAECGDFDAAVKWEMKAMEFAPDSVKKYSQKRLELYRAHKPYRATLPQGVSASHSSK